MKMRLVLVLGLLITVLGTVYLKRQFAAKPSGKP